MKVNCQPRGTPYGLRDFMKLPGRVPPPKSLVDTAGKTPGCKACDSGKGKHSVACQTRYSKGLESHNVSASGSKVVVAPSGAPESGRIFAFTSTVRSHGQGSNSVWVLMLPTKGAIQPPPSARVIIFI